MFKNLFQKSKLKDPLNNENQRDVVLRLMFEIAMSDGNLDTSELQLLKKRAELISPEGLKASDMIKQVIDESESSVSLYPTVTKINEEYSVDQKKEVLKKLWELVTVDGIINHYEENLYFKIAELIKIKRSQANQIKQKAT
ncbi:TerB family tellurite resistance protein [Gammaproteobacteria bacterium]|jgi:uncharacterized tellurite resistance protein B-like protein|nr:TerB family tellurite resistance protein [Gammaproteobacteria bacterium]